MNLKNTQTLKNLARAFATETHDGARYQFMRQQAETQELNYLANLLKIFATNEMAHAQLWWDLITDEEKTSYKNIDTTVGFGYEVASFNENFRIVAEVEKNEGESIYKDFASTARKEGFDEIGTKFDLAAEVERKHHEILTQIYEGLKNNTLYKSQTEVAWKCTNCGHIGMSKEAWKICALCGSKQGYAEGQIQLK